MTSYKDKTKFNTFATMENNSDILRSIEEFLFNKEALKSLNYEQLITLYKIAKESRDEAMVFLKELETL